MLSNLAFFAASAVTSNDSLPNVSQEEFTGKLISVVNTLYDTIAPVVPTLFKFGLVISLAIFISAGIFSKTARKMSARGFLISGGGLLFFYLIPSIAGYMKTLGHF